MRNLSLPILAALLCSAIFSTATPGQSEKGGIDLTARIAPTAARPEPVRQFTFYVLTRSYAQIAHDVDTEHSALPRDEFIDTLKCSPELKKWLKAHDVMDLTMPDVDKLFTPEDIVTVPEFLKAYQLSNSGGVTNGLPKPKYKDTDKTDNPEKYQKEYQDYLDSLKKFIQGHPGSISGMELDLRAVNPQDKWAKVGADHRTAVQRLAPEIAQAKYLVAKTDTDLDGHASLYGLPPGNYWISSLNLDADAGDARLRWDVPITISPGRTTRIELTNLNATDAHSASIP